MMLKLRSFAQLCMGNRALATGQLAVIDEDLPGTVPCFKQVVARAGGGGAV